MALPCDLAMKGLVEILALSVWGVLMEQCNNHVRHVSTYFGWRTGTVDFQNSERKFTPITLNSDTVMKNIVRALVIFALLILGAFNNVGTTKYRVRKIIIDAGHGGHDSGALGKFSKEKDIALEIALELGEILKKKLFTLARQIYL
jgi:N-acetylmuramoyl-L-alanine amidase